jgi:NAD-dependent dihydropyrimidine dehydrogenase PreA subunit
MRHPIDFWRRVVQTLTFVVLIYGGFFFRPGDAVETQPFPLAPDAVTTTKLPPTAIAWAPGDPPAIDAYPPGSACRFNPGGGMFKACIVHMLSENLTWQTRVAYLLGYVLVFVVLAFLLARVWCGWVCPLGTMGDVLTWVRRRFRIDRVAFPTGFRQSLRYSAWGLFGLVLAVSTWIGFPENKSFQCYLFLPYCQLCPARLLCPMLGGRSSTWADFTNGYTTFFTLGSWIFLGLFAAAYFAGRRLWCWLCPIGLVTSWFNRGAAVELRKDARKCNRCAACADACPMSLDHVARERQLTVLNDPNCILCLRCVDACPREGCLTATFFGRKVVGSKFRGGPREAAT